MKLHESSLAIALLLASASAVGKTDVLIPPDELVAGDSQTEWSVRWWQWAFSFERVRSPISDRTGEMCASRQSGDVWFLAGTYGTRRTERSCTVPFGKVLLFPLINYVTFRGEGTKEDCVSLAVRAAALTDRPSALILDIDGKRYNGLDSHRLATPCFGLVPGQHADAVSNGYYVAIRPLSRGRHVLNFGGALPDMLQAVTYTLTVE
jgi:hypothetical protein